MLLTLVATGTIAPAASSAEDYAPLLLKALTRSAIAGIEHGNPTAAGTLGTLVGLEPPWQQMTVQAVEGSDLIDWLNNHEQPAGPTPNPAVDELLGQLAQAQGAALVGDALTVSSGSTELSLDFSGHDVQWLSIAPPAGDGAELIVTSADCTPDLTAFTAGTRFPAQPLNVSIRYSSTLASVPATGPLLVRVSRGNCEDGTVPLSVAWGAPRQIAPNGAASSLVVTPAQPMIVSLSRASSRMFDLEAKRNHVYTVYAAPMREDVDPELARADPDDPASVIDENDDGGWGLGARLEEFLGTDAPEHLLVMRGSASQGNVALLVQDAPVEAYPTAQRPPVPVDPARSTWRTLRLSQGSWAIGTVDRSANVDPTLQVYESATGRLLAKSEDATDSNRAARVVIHLAASAGIIVKLDAAGGPAGTARLRVTRVRCGHRASTRLGPAKLPMVA
jgi:hypothetical protein